MCFLSFDTWDIDMDWILSKQKYNHFCLQNLTVFGVHNAMNNDWLKPVSIPLSEMKWFYMRFNRPFAKGAKFVQSA